MLPLQLQPLCTLHDDSGQRLVEIEHDPAWPLLCVRWFGNLTGEQVIAVARQTLEMRGAMRYELLLNDKRGSTGDWSESLDWLEFEWLPQARAGGLRAVAYVFSPDMHNQLASARFVQRILPHLPIEVFYDLPAAVQWLSTAVAARQNPASADA